MERKNQKEYYLKIGNEKVVVSEEVYRVYVRPIRAEQKRISRSKRCVIRVERNGVFKNIRCKGNCYTCEKYDKENFGNSSLENLMESGYDFEDTTVNIEENLIMKENSFMLREAISKLNERQQEIVRLIYFEGYSQTEVAKRFNVSCGAINNSLSRILASLKKILKN